MGVIDHQELAAAIGRISSSPRTHEKAVWKAAAHWNLPYGPAIWQSSDKCVAYLASFGYHAANLDEWEIAPSASCQGSTPILSLSIVEDGGLEQGLEPTHVEKAGFTWYRVDCALQPSDGQPMRMLEWCAPRRLRQLRESLHLHIKEGFGQKYGIAFAQTPFAQLGAPRGTSSRLRDWLRRLATVINQGDASPAMTALVLEFFQAPEKSTNEAGYPDEALDPAMTALVLDFFQAPETPLTAKELVTKVFEAASLAAAAALEREAALTAAPLPTVLLC